MATIIVTHNPDIDMVNKILNTIKEAADTIIIVDNDSSNKDAIASYCNIITSCNFIEIGFNSGIGYALKIGIRYAISRYNPKWLLLLDDDSILKRRISSIIIEILRKLPNDIGVIRVSYSDDEKCRVYSDYDVMFSGTFIRSEIASTVCCRENFFLDQADYDMYYNIRKLGFKTLLISCRIIEHRLGSNEWIPILSNIVNKPLPYEPPWRLYYIARNSTILLLEQKLDFKTYVFQLSLWSIKSLFKDGIKRSIKAVGLGLLHGLLRRGGYLSKKYFE